MKLQRRSSNEKGKPQRKESPVPKADKDKRAIAGNEPFSINLRIESPPLVSFGPPEDSSGALLSGILDLVPRQTASIPESTFEVQKLEMKLEMEVTTRRPIGHNCPACTVRSKVLNTWTFIASRRVLPYNGGNRHGFPFSFLLPGNLPATTRSSLAIVSYKLVAEAIPVQPATAISPISGPGRPASPKRSDSYKPVVLIHPLQLTRSILPNVEPKECHRIFPPTSLTAMLSLPNVIYPGSTDNAIDLTIKGLKINEIRLRWSLRKISWRLNELAKVVSPACSAHSSKVGGVEGKGILYEDTRVVGAGEIKSGWKHDPSAGKIECVMQIGSPVQTMAACDVDAMSGVHVSHSLVIECVVAEEMFHGQIGPPKRGQYQPTGNARVLRMSFPLIMTERGGMGISWDEEIPPRYEDVAWNAPPTFAQSEGTVEADSESMEGEIEIFEGIRRPRSAQSPMVNPRRDFSPMMGPQLTRTDSGATDTSLRI